MTTVLGAELPSHWSAAPLKHVTSVLNRGSAPNYVDVGSVRAISQASNQPGGLDWNRTRFHDFHGNPSNLKGYLRPDDVLINSTGTGTLGRIGYFTSSPDELPCMADSHVTVARTQHNQLHPRFAYYWLSSKPFQEYIYAALIVGATNQIELNRDRLGDAPVPLPPLPEQRRIAHFLDGETARIDRIVELRTRHDALFGERSRRAIEELATGSHLPSAPSGNPWIRRVPEGWTVLPLKRRWRVIDCKHRTPDYTETGYPVVSPGDVTPGRLDLSRAHRFVGEQDFRDLADDLRRPRRGDIVYSRNASVGIASYVDTDTPFTMGQDVCRITSDAQDQLFLSYVLNTVALAELRSLQVGSTFARVNISTLLQLSIPCPPPEEQSRIAQRMDQVAAGWKRFNGLITGQLGVLAERRSALITAAVTGQFDVTAANGRNVTEGVSV
ncbi:restriction endonuclease subunit S [Streptomyces sp. NPDC001595]|uniref:restriction endonuclease subunit S n=1 Tax=Streptomyces sp. NPDC001532 TaxID=3154520 RepID=UPI00331F5CAD